MIEPRPWKTWPEGPDIFKQGSFSESNAASPGFTAHDIRFTSKGEAIYAIFFAWPEQEAKIRSLGSKSPLAPRKISEVRLLGEGERLKWRRTPDALTIETPKQRPCQYAFVFKIS